MAEFVHLHVHSQYSFLTSTLKLDAIAQHAKEKQMGAIALTDHANMFGAVRFYNSCKKFGVLPLLGCELNVLRAGNGQEVDHLVLLAASNEGYHNLVRLVSRSHTRSASVLSPSLTLDQVAESSKGLIALSGCLNGVVPQCILDYGPEQGEAKLAVLRDLFEPGHLFVELQDHGLPEQPVVNDILQRAAARLDLPVVATNDVHFATRDDGEAHLYLECVRRNQTYEEARVTHHGSFEMFLKGPEEMAQTFRACPEALHNTLRVAEMCSALELSLGKPMLPHFQVPTGFDTASYLRHVATAGLNARLAEVRASGQNPEERIYRERLELELQVIIQMDFPGYFLIVWDFIREAKARGIPVGPGRGSGAGSLVAYSLGITELDPLPYNLLFERFLNPERVSMPDFDIDFCMDRRDEVIAYVAEKYGVDSVGQIATYQNLKARSVIKDVARTMGISPAEAQRVANLVPDLGQGKTATIEQALETEPKLVHWVETDSRIAELLKQARKLEGLTRHAGMHAAGVVISQGPLENYVPCFLSDNSIVTQYDKDDVELAGLVKFDFLGLKTLTVIAIAQRLVNARPNQRHRPLDLSRVPLDDPATYQLISSGDTTNVFQLESSGMQQRVLRKLKPDCFEDIVAAVALYRPGPLSTGMVESFIECKHGRQPIRRLHPLVDGVLEPTYGVPVYQEQVMQIAQHLAGYSLGGADLLRRAMGKKKADVMAKHRQIFVEGAAKNAVSEAQALAIFQEIEGFAQYGFNKSHSAAYAVVTYQTAYLKAHYPAEFFAAVMTADKDKIEKVVRTVAEARTWGVSVLPPDINHSDRDFTVVYGHPLGDGPTNGPGKLRDPYGPQIRFGLGAIRGVGESALEAVFEARASGGPFRDLFDFAARVDAKRLNRGVLEALIQCGAFDSVMDPLGIARSSAFAAVEAALERSKSASRDRQTGQTNLFGLFAAAQPRADRAKGEYPDVDCWDRFELLRREKESLGCYVSGHPLLRYGALVSRLGAVSTPRLSGLDPFSKVTVAGMIEDYRERVFKEGGKAAFFQVEDMHGRVLARMRGEAIDEFAPVLNAGDPVLVTGSLRFPQAAEESEELEPTLHVSRVEPLAELLLASARLLSIRVAAEKTGRADLVKLKDLLRAHPGACPVELCLVFGEGAEVWFSLPDLRVRPRDELLAGLERLFGDTAAELR